MGWTCPECGLDYDSVAPGDMPVAIRSFPRRYREATTLRPGEDAAVLRTRAEPDVWSALEYTAHVDDEFDLFADGFRNWLATGDTGVEWWDPDERAAAERYNDRDPEELLASLKARSEALADVLDRVGADDWTRTAPFPWGERDLLTMARNAVHEGSHHLRDIDKVLARVRAARQ